MIDPFGIRARRKRASLCSHFARPWAMRTPDFEALVGEIRARVGGLSAADWRALVDSPYESREPAVDADGVAHLSIHGAIVPSDAGLFRAFGLSATGADEILEGLRAALADTSVTGIALHFNSPGGAVERVPEVADAIAEAARQTYVTAYVVGQCCSAAYWMASQADEIIAEASSLVGAIGVYSVIEDSSRLFEDAGIKVHVLRTGPHKGAGVPGTAVTEDQLAAEQRIVTELGGMFADAVDRGRALRGALDSVTTGEAWLAARAAELGLVDTVAGPSVSPAPFETSASASSPELQGELPAPGALSPSGSGDNLDEIAALKAELAMAQARAEAESRARSDFEQRAIKAEAAAEAHALARAEQTRRAVVGLIDKYPTRVTPAMRPRFEALAEKAYSDDPEGFEAILRDLPEQLHTVPQGHAPAQAIKPADYSDEDVAKFAEIIPGFRSALAVHDQSRGANSIEPDGRLSVVTDGHRRTVGSLPSVAQATRWVPRGDDGGSK